MTIKRNVKKFNNSNSKGCTQGTKLKSLGLGKYEFPTYNKVPGGEYFSEIKEARRTVSAKGMVGTGKGKYKFPKVDEVPSNIYFSQIVSANESVTYNGKSAVDVFYIIRDAHVCQAVMNNKLPKNTEKKLYYIKQRYPVDTPCYDEFVEAMEKALELEPGTQISFQDIAGITELVSLSYQHINGIGGFDQRRPFLADDFILLEEDDEVYDENNELEESKELQENTKQPDNNKSKPITYDADDEFDDFLDDDC